MCPTWSRIAEEIDSLACDRALAASVEPDPREQAFLINEALLLRRAARYAATEPHDGLMVHIACAGVVVHRERFLMWGIGDGAERGLRRLAMRRPAEVASLDPCHVLRVVLGVPADGAAAPHQVRLAS